MKNLILFISLFFVNTLNAQELPYGHKASSTLFIVDLGVELTTEKVTKIEELDQWIDDSSKQTIAYKVILSYFENGGKNAQIVSYNGETNFLSLRRKVNALTFDYLSTPDFISLETQAYATRVRQFATIVNNKKAFYFIDLPFQNNVSDNRQYLELIKTAPLRRSAIYYPNFKTDDVDNLPNSGVLAGIFSNNDLMEGLWRTVSPITTPVHKNYKLNKNVSTTQCQNLSTVYPLHMNCLITAQNGPTVWGARVTDTSDPEKKYINVVRLEDHVESLLLDKLSWVKDSENTQETWNKISEQVRNIFYSLWRKGAFVGAQYNQGAYVLVGLGSSMNQNEIDQGLTRITYGFAPLRPGEFMSSNIVIRRPNN